MLLRTLQQFHGRCDDAMRDASERIDAPISWRRRAKLWFHVRTCSACAMAVLQMGLIRAGSIKSGTDDRDVPRLDEAARERIARELARAHERPD